MMSRGALCITFNFVGMLLVGIASSGLSLFFRAKNLTLISGT
jgi:hypothetical protein